MKSKNKGIILATHQLQYLKFADKIIVLNDGGEQVFYGRYEDLKQRSDEFGFLDIEKPQNAPSNDSSKCK